MMARNITLREPPMPLVQGYCPGCPHLTVFCLLFKCTEGGEVDALSAQTLECPFDKAPAEAPDA